MVFPFLDPRQNRISIHLIYLDDFFDCHPSCAEENTMRSSPGAGRWIMFHLKRCTRSSSKPRSYEETMRCRFDPALEPMPAEATPLAPPCCVSTHRSRVVDPIPQRFWFTGRLSPQDHR